MELGLTLGHPRPSPRPFFLLPKPTPTAPSGDLGLELGFYIGRGEEETRRDSSDDMDEEEEEDDDEEDKDCSGGPPVQHQQQLNLLPFSPVARQLPPPPHLLSQLGLRSPPDHGRGVVDVNVAPSGEDAGSFQVEFGGSRASDEEENGITRKKLRLSKEQSAYLEESFKEHNTLNPKQKLALAKQLHLRPRQVEVWFQNRRARTKLKQTEVDCEYLKRCCEKLTEENRRLQKELQELRALKTIHPYYMHLPATTLTMCPSCERVATAKTDEPNARARFPPFGPRHPPPS